MHATPDHSRWGAFNPDERELIQSSLTLSADSLHEDVERGEVADTSLEVATTVVDTARSLADEIGEAA